MNGLDHDAGQPHDPLADVRDALAHLDQHPITEHVTVLGRSLDAIVAELDELARSIPSAR